jgi:CRP-like cAMP-binding protein
VTAVDTALERELSVQLMHGGQKPKITRLAVGDTLVRQGDPGSEVFLVLDGVIRVDKDGQQLAEYGPGALLGERSHLEGGIRTSTPIAATACRVASVPASQFDTGALTELATGHRREEAAQG